ncbi:MAG: hypothetical protein ABFS56_02145 [Pseudomonadota bacterium]
MNQIRRLDAETSKRRREVAKAENSTKNLLDLDLKALAAVNPSLLEKLLKRIEEAKRENQ